MAIDWCPIAGLPDALKDGREVLVWDGENADVACWQEHAHFGQGDPGWQDTGVGGELSGITHYAEIDPPA
ncbi:hypothetical protein LH128_05178 [Sphingomonas sp. LH128]|uniref:hypothetical protein n=1 Tax=Sphingomonas sp. LH128 TaxID=473781 RepID=UPI00027C9B17|nr:hypothetical protein [Sphingomonas sp. LH128]EJU14124.1 hypothetical protein LH128_05178 [Sphingomonas sp. LH128]